MGLAGITTDYLYQIERGKKLPTVPVLLVLARVLGVSAGGLARRRQRQLRSTRGAVGVRERRASRVAPVCAADS
ncbi:helix-turn-helix transcriptional regulator [Saccharopolyspora shandongensis]|uniref:helix-turn-helix domain-containing protein n=1 Tax=Saccharopolyspora shandongensis TaxID=418495 RepID=UPI003428371D